MRISIKENKDKEINVKVYKDFQVVWPIMPTSTNERIFHYYETKVQDLSIKVLKQLGKNLKNHSMSIISRKY